MAELLTRRDALAAAIQHEPGPITTQLAARLNAASGFSPHRNTARKDLRSFVRAGVLFSRLDGGRHTYTRTETPMSDPTEATTAGTGADFFQPGHGYTHRNGHDFQCVAIARHPITAERRAFGWLVRNGWPEGVAQDPDDWQQYDGCAAPEGGDA